VKKKTVRDLSDAELRGKRVLVRVDFMFRWMRRVK